MAPAPKGDGDRDGRFRVHMIDRTDDDLTAAAVLAEDDLEPKQPSGQALSIIVGIRWTGISRH